MQMSSQYDTFTSQPCIMDSVASAKPEVSPMP
jgi:hypothetical protein